MVTFLRNVSVSSLRSCSFVLSVTDEKTELLKELADTANILYQTVTTNNFSLLYIGFLIIRSFKFYVTQKKNQYWQEILGRRLFSTK